MLIVDTNVIAYFYLDPAYLPQLRLLLDYDKLWASPSIWRNELRNVLLLYLRKGQITMDRALEVMAEAERLLGGIEYQPLSVQVLNLALTSGCTAYDCEYVALARTLGTVLVTYDRKLLSAFPTIAFTPTAFLASSG